MPLFPLNIPLPRKRLGRAFGIKLALELKIPDLWIGVFWKRDKELANCDALNFAPHGLFFRPALELSSMSFGHNVDIWICLLPCLPLHLSFTWKTCELRGRIKVSLASGGQGLNIRGEVAEIPKELLGVFPHLKVEQEPAPPAERKKSQLEKDLEAVSFDHDHRGDALPYATAHKSGRPSGASFGCHRCPARFSTLEELFKHRDDVHDTRCALAFGGVFCGLTPKPGEECDKKLSTCRDKGNEARFGGFPQLPTARLFESGICPTSFSCESCGASFPSALAKIVHAKEHHPRQP